MNTIEIFGRLKPTSNPSDSLEVTEDEPNTIKITSAPGSGEKVQYAFRFNQVFDVDTPQETVFDTVAKKICDRFLEGFNCTLFAYGQTGSGKTFTIEGGSRSFAERGILPRAISYIYSKLQERTDESVTVQVTYLEIYNENAFDLLSVSSTANARLPKVTVTDRGTSCVLQNLSVHSAANEDVAQSLLFLGRSNRTVAKTSMNLQSSRSHSVFTIMVQSQKNGSEYFTKSKFHIVDLAGSERVHKSGAEGQQLKEARHINLSLHYLESVIIALQQNPSNRNHVPYRNSLLTRLLRDSLGGNCVTAMIANLSIEASNQHESLSTCRFAQRVALVSNDVKRNEVLDDKVVIKLLRRKVAELQAELVIANDALRESRPASVPGSSKPTDRHALEKLVKDFVGGKVKDLLQGVSAAHDLRTCFELLRSSILGAQRDVEELELAVQEAMKKEDQLKDLKAKFGVTRAKLRTLETAMVPASGYGKTNSSKRKSLTRSNSSPGIKVETFSPKPKNANPPITPGKKEEFETRQSQKASRPGDDVEIWHQKARKLASFKRAELIVAEKECVMAIENLKLKLQQQAIVLQQCDLHAPHRILPEKVKERDMERELAQLEGELVNIRKQFQQLEHSINSIPSRPADKEPHVSATSRSQNPRPPSLQTSTSQHGAMNEKVRDPRKGPFTASLNQPLPMSSKPDPLRAPDGFGRGDPIHAAFPAAHRTDPFTRSKTMVEYVSPEEKLLAQSQRELELREAATREKLMKMKLELKQQMLGISVPSSSNNPVHHSSQPPHFSKSASLLETSSSGPKTYHLSSSSSPTNKYPPKEDYTLPDMPTRSKTLDFPSLSSQPKGILIHSSSSRPNPTHHNSSPSYNNHSQNQVTSPKSISFKTQRFPSETGSSDVEHVAIETPKVVKLDSVQKAKSDLSDKEKRYNSSLDQQKDRITRIRMTIKAAQVIQRAWKAYRLRKRVSGGRKK